MYKMEAHQCGGKDDPRSATATLAPMKVSSNAESHRPDSLTTAYSTDKTMFLLWNPVEKSERSPE